MKRIRFFKCNVCGQIIAIVHDTNLPIVCCGKEMKEIIPSTKDMGNEKHVPVYKRKCDTVEVNVGEIDHPMEPKHHINWIMILTDKGYYTKSFRKLDKPNLKFCIDEDEVICSIYSYCNIHGLWINEIEEC